MFNNKNFDCLIIGENYLSLVLGIVLSNQKKRVLLVRGETISDSRWSNFITELDYLLLKKMGEKFGIGSLVNIKNYLDQVFNIYNFGMRSPLLGDNPIQNIHEILKKYPEFLTDEISFEKLKDDEALINDAVKDIMNQTIDIILSKGQLSKRDIQLFLDKAPRSLSDFFIHFRKTVKESLFQDFDKNVKSQLTQNFLYIFQAFNYARPSISTPPDQIFILFLLLISRRFKVKEKELSDQLRLNFVENGGINKITKIVDFKFSAEKIKRVQLESFEGVIYPQEIFYWGAIEEEGLPFSYRPASGVCEGISLFFPLSHVANYFQDKRYFFGYQDKMGTDLALWKIAFNQNGIDAVIFYPKKVGTKASFYLDESLQLIIKSLQQLIPNLKASDLEKPHISLCPNDILFTEEMDDLQNRQNRYSKHLIQDKKSGETLKEIQYLGPSPGNHFGLFSILIDLWRFAHIS